MPASKLPYRGEETNAFYHKINFVYIWDHSKRHPNAGNIQILAAFFFFFHPPFSGITPCVGPTQVVLDLTLDAALLILHIQGIFIAGPKVPYKHAPSGIRTWDLSGTHCYLNLQYWRLRPLGHHGRFRFHLVVDQI